ncbi:MAG: hypothetical protein QXR58_02565 [Candidatus Micrarchaeaceae archaeon]
MELLLLRTFSVLAFSLVYMIFDVFNRRNIPSVFAFASVAYGALLTVLYFNLTIIAESSAIALLVIGVGYLLYKGGQLGAADVTEFAALSLMLPIQYTPLLYKSSQFGLPFIVSLIINGGISAFVVVLLYYLPRAKSRLKKPLLSMVSNYEVMKAVGIAFAYMLFLLLLVHYTGFYPAGIALLLAILILSVLIILFERPLTYSMISYVSVRNFEPGDIIAFNLLSQSMRESLKKRIPKFDRLVTEELISEMKKRRLYNKLPVYKNAMPMALPIFVGVCISLLFGDILLVMLPFVPTIFT